MAHAVRDAILLALLAFLGGSSFGMSALGIALIFEIGYFLLASMSIFASQTLTQANVYLTVALLPMAFVEAGYLRKHWNIRFVVLFGVTNGLFTAIGIDPPLFITPPLITSKHVQTIAGIFILNYNDTVWLARSLGIFLLISFCILCYIQYLRYKQRKQLQHFESFDLHSSAENQHDSVVNLVENVSSKHGAQTEEHTAVRDDGVEFKVDSITRAFVLIVLGLVSGLLRGVWGVGGIPVMFFALLTNIKKDVFRASIAFALILSESVAVVQLFIVEHHWEDTQVAQYIGILIGAFLGLLAGNQLSPYLNQQSFHVLIMYLIFCGAVILTTRGLVDQTTDLVVSLVLSVLALVLFSVWLCRSCKDHRKPITRDHEEQSQVAL